MSREFIQPTPPTEELRQAAIHRITTDEVNVIVKMLRYGLARVSLGKSERVSAKNALGKLDSQ